MLFKGRDYTDTPSDTPGRPNRWLSGVVQIQVLDLWLLSGHTERNPPQLEAPTMQHSKKNQSKMGIHIFKIYILRNPFYGIAPRESSAASSNYDPGAQFDVDVKVLASKWFVKLRNKVFKDQCLKGATAHYRLAI